MGTIYGPASRWQVSVSSDEEWSELPAGGRHIVISEGSHGAPVDHINEGWTWTLPLVLSVAIIVALGGWLICG